MVNKSKNKGNAFELLILKKLKKINPELAYSPRGSGNGEEKGDIIFEDYCIECKHQKSISRKQLKTWWFKLQHETDLRPLIIFRENNRPIMVCEYYDNICTLKYFNEWIDRWSDTDCMT